MAPGKKAVEKNVRAIRTDLYIIPTTIKWQTISFLFLDPPKNFPFLIDQRDKAVYRFSILYPSFLPSFLPSPLSNTELNMTSRVTNRGETALMQLEEMKKRRKGEGRSNIDRDPSPNATLCSSFLVSFFSSSSKSFRSTVVEQRSVKRTLFNSVAGEGEDASFVRRHILEGGEGRNFPFNFPCLERNIYEFVGGGIPYKRVK